MTRDVITLRRLAAMPSDEAAALWTVRVADGLYPYEQEIFEEWLALAPANRAAFERAQHSWNLFEDADNDELIDEMRRHARAAVPHTTHDWRRYAAGVGLLLGVAGSLLLVERSGMLGGGGNGGGTAIVQNAPVVEASYSTGRELPKRIVLPDGSTMTLDAQSAVVARFSSDRRKLQLVGGRALFEVRHDPARPFTVSARDVQTVDIGTRFEVGLQGNDVRVTLLEGRVAVTARGTVRVTLAPGQQLVARDGSAPRISRTGEDALAWQQGFATFDNDTLGEAAATFNRYPGDEIIVRDPGVAATRISGHFRLGDAERFGRTLEQIYPVHVVRRGPHAIEVVPS